MKLNGLTKYGLAVFTLIVAPLLVVAQQAGGSLKGVVVDQMGASIPGAKVLITNGFARRELKTDETGAFSVEIPSGSYQVLIESPGFRVAKLSRVRIQSDSSKEIRVVLRVRPVKYGKCPRGQTCVWL